MVVDGPRKRGEKPAAARTGLKRGLHIRPRCEWNKLLSIQLVPVHAGTQGREDNRL